MELLCVGRSQGRMASCTRTLMKNKGYLGRPGTGCGPAWVATKVCHTDLVTTEHPLFMLRRNRWAGRGCGVPHFRGVVSYLPNGRGQFVALRASTLLFKHGRTGVQPLLQNSYLLLGPSHHLSLGGNPTRQLCVFVLQV